METFLGIECNQLGMNVKLYGLLPLRNSYCLPTLYGYATKGLPGIEIVGLGSAGRGLKEKLIFITREMRQKYPMKRYVLSVEGHEEVGKDQTIHLRNLELGFLILFWKLAGIVSISNIEQCLCSGQLSVRGELSLPVVKEDYWINLSQYLESKNKTVTVIGPSLIKNYPNLNNFNAHELLRQVNES